MITFSQIRSMNLARCNLWHPIQSWSIMQWACAVAGETGEMCNIAKKIQRQDDKIVGNALSYDKEEWDFILGEECADIFIYLDLLCASRGIDLEGAIKRKFNSVSIKHDFPQRLRDEK